MVDAIDRLITGFRRFRADYYEQRPGRMRELAEQGQSPEVMLIACSDSRVDPALVLDSEPGEIFVVRNVANIVPPYGPDDGHYGTSAALEFAVRDLGVQHIIVLGHSDCGGIKALRAAVSGEPSQREFIKPWVEIVKAACRCGDGGAVPDQPDVEQAAIRLSLGNLETFPWIAAKIASGEIQLHGWWIDLENGRLFAVDPDKIEISEIVGG
jgi:carbonic anhydrase